MKRFLTPIFSAVLVLALLTVASAQGTPNPGVGNVNLTVMNMDAADDASVQVSYINSSGVVDSSKSTVLAARSSEGFPITQSNLPDGWSGSAIVSSDKQIVAFAQARWEYGSSADGRTAGAYNGFVQGASKLFFVYLAARSGKQVSRLSIQSAEGASTSSSINFTIKYYDRDGTLNKTVNDSVLKGTQKTYNLLDVGLTPNRSDGWLGAAVVESASPIAGVATMHWQEYAGAYSALTGGGETIYLPSGTRRIIGGDWFQYMSMGVQNLDPSTDADVTVRWYDRDGNELYSFDDTIPANSAHGYNTRQTGSDVPNHTALHGALGENWNGSVVIRSNTAGVELAAVANLQWTADSPVGTAASSYSSEASGYQELFVPGSFRLQSSGTWKQFTGLVVQNVGSSVCTDFSVTWRNRSGTLLLSYIDSLNPNISHGYNTRYGADMPSGANPADLGADFRGSVYVNAPGCELIGIHNTLWPSWTDSTTYNAFGQ